jgi:glycosyltransferase involved in cell wall biosynthesis
LHYALEAWLQSKASVGGVFLIVGEFIPAYAEKLSAMLAHPSVRIMGYRKDLNEIMRACDVFTLPSIEEGSALVTHEARASGCVLLVSGSAGAICEDAVDSFVHATGDVAALRSHLDLLFESPGLLSKLRASSLDTVSDITWRAAGRKLNQAYRELVGL